MIEVPQSFVVREECEKAAFQNGFRRALGETEGWAVFASTTALGTIYLASVGIHGPWFLALDHTGVIAELDLPTVAIPGPGKAHYVFGTLGELYAVMHRAYALSVSLPDAPLREFETRVRNLPRTTEAERLVVQRIGQEIFRARLMDYWQGCCPLTGIAEPGLLRASHIVAWIDCDHDEHRLDVYNGLFLSALWDAAFDRGLVSFTDEGAPLASPQLGLAARASLRFEAVSSIPNLRDAHRINLHRHRLKHGF